MQSEETAPENQDIMDMEINPDKLDAQIDLIADKAKLVVEYVLDSDEKKKKIKNVEQGMQYAKMMYYGSTDIHITDGYSENKDKYTITYEGSAKILKETLATIILSFTEVGNMKLEELFDAKNIKQLIIMQILRKSLIYHPNTEGDSNGDNAYR